MPAFGSVINLGATLGYGTNNTGELYALGMLFQHLLLLKTTSLPYITIAYIFCDSKIAISAASSNKPKSNITLSKTVAAAFKSISALIRIELHWIRGHSRVGGNERVDRISKRYAQVEGNSTRVPFDPFFRTHTSTSN